MSAALESALQALARMKGGSDVSAVDLKQALDEVFGRHRVEGDDVDGRDDLPH